MSKRLSFGAVARLKIKAGINGLAKAVSCTLGPKGRNVLIEKSYGPPVITKDGFTVAKEIEFENNLENLGADVIKEVSALTNKSAGDGTTTSIVLANSMMEWGLEALNRGVNPIDVQKGMLSATEIVLKDLEMQAINIKGDTEAITNVASISANNDEEVGKIIAEAIVLAGEDGMVKIDKSTDNKTTIEHTKGMYFDRGLFTQHFANGDNGAIMEDVHILITNHTISDPMDINVILDETLPNNKALLLIVEDLEGEALKAFTLYKVQHPDKDFSVVKVPSFGDDRLNILEDIAAVTGGTFVSKGKGMDLDTITMTDLGNCKKVIIDDKTTTIIPGDTDYSSLLEKLKSEVLVETESFKKDRLKSRIAKLSSGVVTIKVGATSEIELGEKIDRVEDAVNAVRSAVEEGVIPGGGLALLIAQRNFYDVGDDGSGHIAGVIAVYNALSAPYKQIFQNAGLDSKEYIKDIRTQLKENNLVIPKSLDISTGEEVDLINNGIIDPLKVTRVALENAVSVVSTVLMTDCAITENN